MASLKNKVMHGMLWATLERFASQLISFIVTMVLARLLTPSDYGTVALLTVFLLFAGILIDSGFGQALVQKKNASPIDFSTAFYFSLAISIIIYFILYLIASKIANFYDTPELESLLKVMALTLVFNAISSVQVAELNRGLLFNLSFKISMISAAASGLVGISLAFMNFGSWALVWSSVAGSFVGMVARWFVITWRPKLSFSFDALKSMWTYSWKLLVSALFDSAYSNLYALLIGKIYSKPDLAYVNKGNHVPRLAMDSINGTLGRVAFPALSILQNQPDKLLSAMRRMISVSTGLVMPAMIGLAVCAKPVVLLLFGEQWIQAVPYLQLSCFTFALWPFHTINLQAIAAVGRSDVYLKLEVIKKIFGLIMLLIFVRKGVLVFMAVSAFVCGPFSLLVNAWPNRRLLGYTIAMQLKDSLPNMLIGLVMGGGCWLIGLAFDGGSCISLIMQLVAQMMLGVVLYVSLALCFKTQTIKEVAKLLLKTKSEEKIIRRDQKRAQHFLMKIDRCTSSRIRLKLAGLFQRWLMTTSPGVFSSYVLERVYLDEAKKINCPLPSAEIGHVLMVMSEAYPWGGHTRWAEKWIESDTNHIYSLVFTRPQESATPQRLVDAVATRGGKIVTIENSLNDIQKATFLRIFSSRFEAVVLDVHMDDTLPLVAYGSEDFRRPIAFLNHSNHLFWVGLSISDFVIECGKWQTDFSAQKRGSSKAIMVRFPNSKVSVTNLTRNEARKVLGIPVSQRMVITAGQPYKYTPVRGLDFRDVLNKVLSSDVTLHVYSIGVSSELSPTWSEISRNYGGRLHLKGTLPQSEFMTYCAAADVLIDSFPFTGGGVMLDATLCKCPCVTICTDIGIADAPYVHCKSIEELIEKTLLFTTNHAMRDSAADSALKGVSSMSTGERENTIRKAMREVCKANHRLTIFPSIQTEIDNNDFTILATRYNGKRNFEFALEFYFMAMRPYWFGLFCYETIVLAYETYRRVHKLWKN